MYKLIAQLLVILFDLNDNNKKTAMRKEDNQANN